jgi:cell division protein FtsI (penicillin-binding protein 3)
LTPSEIIARSSNVGISKIGSAMGRERLYHVLKNFGFGTAPGSGLPGEVAGLLRPHQRWYAHDAATIPFGQAMSTTPLQLAMSMSALANKGRLLEPLLIRRVVDARGQTVEEGLPRLRKQVVPEHVARLVTEMMEGVVREGGTAQEAAIDGYRVAGKTGTAQKSDPTQGGYSDKKYIASFVGFAPANNPKLTIAVVLDEPMIQHQGGQVAAPVFRRVMADSLRHLGVPAERSQATAAALPHAQPQPSKTASNTQADAPQRRASEVPAGRVHVGPSQTLVPNLIGRPARQAVVQARQAMLEVSLQGSGVVSSQQPLAGVVVQRGSSIALQLISPTPDLPAPPLASDLAQVGPAQEPGKAADTVEPAPVRRGQDG